RCGSHLTVAGGDDTGVALVDAEGRRSSAGADHRLREAYAVTPYHARLAPPGPRLALGDPGQYLGPAMLTSSEPRFYLADPGPGPPATGLEARAADAAAKAAMRRALGRAAEVRPPPYLLAALGPVPSGVDDRAVWRAAAVEVESYRRTWGVVDRDRALGPEGGDGGADRRFAARSLASAARQLGRDPLAGRDLGPELSAGRSAPPGWER
ncbi:MAG TPA: hypothetical protein VFH45_04555, partial [Acidimicrobiales bacterium]|nr:hypothetical protein [Acidimicrobiales bacterium]